MCVNCTINVTQNTKNDYADMSSFYLMAKMFLGPIHPRPTHSGGCVLGTNSLNQGGGGHAFYSHNHFII